MWGLSVDRRLFIHAPNVHQGGGRALLSALLGALPPEFELVVSLDARIELAEEKLQKIDVKRVVPSVIQRFLAELWLRKQVGKDDIVLCFGNLPPLFKLRGRTVVYVQNRYLVVKLAGFSFKSTLRLLIERLWLSHRTDNVDEFVVQTPSMDLLMRTISGDRVPVRVVPFVALNRGYGRKIQNPGIDTGKAMNFLYVASGEPHKNHRQLIEAWCLLASDGVFPVLTLTLDCGRFPELWTWIESKTSQYGMNVVNAGNVRHSQIGSLYSKAAALIYPSTIESLGLPLIEARQAGLAVLASELDYVRDVIDPEQTFDPESAISIARAVKRFMALDEPSLPLKDAKEFMAELLEDS